MNTKMKKQTEVRVLLHNIRSTHNVGSIFRTSDALGVNKIYLSGYTPTPLDRFGKPRKDVAKVALGAERIIPWEYIKKPEEVIKKLKKAKPNSKNSVARFTEGGFREKYKVIGIEQSKKSIDYKKVKVTYPVLFIVGNEVDGIPKNVLSLCDIVAEIPMRGDKESLNVSVAFGVALFRILNR